jgi:RNA polymerase sigma factor (sigma-70 family)
MNVAHEYNEKALLLQVAQGDETAFGILFHRYRHKIFYFAWRFLQSESKAEDVLQEIFLKVWTGKELLPDIKNFKAWLTTITRNHIYNALRRLTVEEAFMQELSVKTGQQQEEGTVFSRIRAGCVSSTTKPISSIRSTIASPRWTLRRPGRQSWTMCSRPGSSKKCMVCT